jgi:serine protease Do
VNRFVPRLFAALVASACVAPPQSADSALEVDAPLPVDLRRVTAVVRVSPPERLRRFFELGAARTDDADVARFFHAQASGGFGSGFVVVRRKRGVRHAFVVTNRHVIADAEDAEVTFSNGTSYAHCRIVYVHPTADLAVIALPDAAPFAFGLDPARGAPMDRQTVIATGYPALGGIPSFQTTEGKISNAAIEGGLIQHTAPIDPGSSGGPLTDARGKLVGVNVSMARGRQNANFAVPASAMIEAVDAAVDAVQHESDAAFLRTRVTTACDKLAAELASKHTNGHAMLDLISIGLVAEQGPPSLVFARSHTTPELSAEFGDMFTKSPLDAYRVSIGYRIALRALAGGGVPPGARCTAINPTDAASIASASAVRVLVPTARGAMELAFGWDRGAYRVVGGDLLDLERLAQAERGKKR